MRACLVFLILVLGVGCKSVPKDSGDDAERLTLAIRTLSPMVDPREARRLAQILVDESLKLANSYGSVGEPWVQNILVNSGVRERGLCFHWVDDLSAVLEKRQFRSLVIHRAGVNLGTLQEHHALVVSPYGGRFEDGLVVDAWRFQGRLHWVRVRAEELQWEKVIEKGGF